MEHFENENEKKQWSTHKRRYKLKAAESRIANRQQQISQEHDVTTQLETRFCIP